MGHYTILFVLAVITNYKYFGQLENVQIDGCHGGGSTM